MSKVFSYSAPSRRNLPVKFNFACFVTICITIFAANKAVLAQPAGGVKPPTIEGSTIITSAALDKERDTLRQELAIMDMEDMGKVKVSLALRNATISDVVEAIRASTPQVPPMEVRNAPETRVTLTIKDTAIGKILIAAAVLTGCEVSLLPDRFVIAPQEALQGDEPAHKYFITYSGGAELEYRNAKRSQIFVKSLLHTLQQLNGEKGRLGDLDIVSQRAAQRIANIQSVQSNTPPEMLPKDAEISTSHNDNGVTTLKINLWSQRRIYSWTIAPSTAH